MGVGRAAGGIFMRLQQRGYLQRVRDGFVHSTAGQTHRARSHSRAREVESLHGNLEAEANGAWPATGKVPQKNKTHKTLRETSSGAQAVGDGGALTKTVLIGHHDLCGHIHAYHVQRRAHGNSSNCGKR